MCNVLLPVKMDQEGVDISTRVGQFTSSVPKWKLSHSIIQELSLFVEALCEELVPLIDGGELLHNGVHDGLFFHQAQPAAVGEGVEIG